MIQDVEEIEEHGHNKVVESPPQVNPTGLFVLDPLRDKRWPTLVNNHKASSVFHSREWLSALRLTYGYQPVVYTNSSSSAELTSGIVLCEVRSWITGHRLVSLPFSDHCDPLVESQVEFDDLLMPIRERMDDGKWGYCEVRPVRFAPGGSTMFGQSDQYVWHAIDLQQSIDTTFRRFHHSVRRKIQRAEREGLLYEEGNCERLLRHFYKLLVTTRKRQQLPPQPLNWFRCLMTTFGENLKISVAFKENLPIASILTLNHKDTVTYKYGCSDARFHPSGGVALVLWNTIQRAKAAGYERLDLGRSDISNEGLTAFKEHWGGIRSDLYYWRFPNCPRSDESMAKRMFIRRVVKMAPDRMLAAMGNLLYPHVG